MLRKKCGLTDRLCVCWKPCPRGLEPGHLSGRGRGGTVSEAPAAASVPGSAPDKADTVRGARGDVCPNHVTRPSLSRILVQRTESQKMSPEQVKTPTWWLSSWSIVWARHARLTWVLPFSLRTQDNWTCTMQELKLSKG